MINEKEILKRIGMEVRVARVRKMLTQKQLANQCGVTKGHIGKVELGKSDAKILTYWRVCDALGISFKDML